MKTQLQQYFRDTLDLNVVPTLWQPARRLPLFLRDGYRFYQANILGNEFLLMADNENDRSAAIIQKHINHVAEKWEEGIIYVRESANSDERRRLVEQKIPFVVPGNQMFLPILGIDFREHFRRQQTDVEKFAPATQAAIILLLTKKRMSRFDAQSLADRLSYSLMTASRTLNELRSAGIEVVSIHGRARTLEYEGDRRTLWEQSLPYLDSPVKQTQHIRLETKRLEAPAAGLTALADYSMLAAPRIPMFALTAESWNELNVSGDVLPAKSNDPEAVGIETWSYDPNLFAKDVVDPFSLFLSLKDDDDERVQISIEEMMEKIQW